MKISAWWLLAALSVGILVTYLYLQFISAPSETVSVKQRGDYDLVTLKLPNASDPRIFGPKYWEAFHRLTDRIPCPDCRSKAVPFMVFFHDLVNKGTGKQIFDKENFNRHIENISKLEKAA